MHFVYAIFQTRIPLLTTNHLIQSEKFYSKKKKKKKFTRLHLFYGNLQYIKNFFLYIKVSHSVNRKCLLYKLLFIQQVGEQTPWKEGSYCNKTNVLDHM